MFRMMTCRSKGSEIMFEYAIYKGDDLIIIGTREECAEELGVKLDTISYYCTPAYRRKLIKRGAEDVAVIGERIKIDESMAL